MKTVWKGAISFGLVSIPINLYSAIEGKALSFRLLHKPDHQPIKYKRFCQDGHEVPWNEITKGVEIAKDRYYEVDGEELEKLKPEKSDVVDIFEFVDARQVDPIYFNSHYYAAPQRQKDKAFFLFKEVLSQSAKVAIGKFVMRQKEYISAIESYKSGLLLTTLNYGYEIRDMGAIEELSSAPKLREEELSLAKQLIDRLYKEEFDIRQFKDTFAEQLKELLRRKEKGEAITVEHKPQAEGKEQDIIKALKQSLREAEA
ncbi:MAG TPA: Ku protein [Candidatus Nanoarchaeia archaeon]|nr:Ku protein [Candidatus Nanoarchaeia archaeon]